MRFVFLLPFMLLLSAAPAPRELPPARIVVRPIGAIVVQPWKPAPKPAEPPAIARPAAEPASRDLGAYQACTYDNAQLRRREDISDNLGQGAYTFVTISSWSCTTFEEMQADYEARRAQALADIAAYHNFRATCLALPEDQQHGCTWPRP